MDIKARHNWDLSPAEAIALQQTLAADIISYDDLDHDIQYVAGIDVGFEDNGQTTRAAVCVLTLSDLAVVDSAVAHLPTTFPYIPGLLSFREVPAILAALEQLKVIPQLLFCDGQGLAHPRHFGIACHVGLLTGLPSIGVGKSKLIGSHAAVGNNKGDWQPLLHKNETLGAVLRSRVNVKPLYISIGHRINLATAVDYVMRCLTRYKLPETTRLADKLASKRAGLPQNLSLL